MEEPMDVSALVDALYSFREDKGEDPVFLEVTNRVAFGWQMEAAGFRDVYREPIAFQPQNTFHGIQVIENPFLPAGSWQWIQR